MRVREFAGGSGVFSTPVAHDFSVKRVFEDEVRCVTIRDQDVSIRSYRCVTRHELSGGDSESCLFGGWKAADDGSVRFEKGDATFLRFWGPSLRPEVPTAIDVDEVFGPVFGEDLDAVSADEAFSEAFDEGAVFFEDEERVFWVIGHEVQESVFAFDHGVTVDDGGGCGIGFAPRGVDAVQGGVVSKNGSLVGEGLRGGFGRVVMCEGGGEGDGCGEGDCLEGG